MTDALMTEATCLAVCARITRGDGVRLAFTTHDRPLVIDGTRHEAFGVALSAVVHEVGAGGGGFEVVVPAAAGVAAADLEAGRFDGAAIHVFLADWRTAAQVEGLATGNVSGASRADDGSVRFSAANALEAWGDAGPVLCSPTCRASLGDAACGVDMAERRLRVLVTPTMRGVRPFTASPLDRFIGGHLRVLSGRWTGLDRRVTASVDGELALDGRVAGNDSFVGELTEGCDRRFATCADRFNNAAAFRGEPHVPGTDALVRHG